MPNPLHNGMEASGTYVVRDECEQPTACDHLKTCMRMFRTGELWRAPPERPTQLRIQPAAPYDDPSQMVAVPVPKWIRTVGCFPVKCWSRRWESNPQPAFTKPPSTHRRRYLPETPLGLRAASWRNRHRAALRIQPGAPGNNMVSDTAPGGRSETRVSSPAKRCVLRLGGCSNAAKPEAI